MNAPANLNVVTTAQPAFPADMIDVQAAQQDFNIKDVTTLTARLTQVLALEVDYLDAMEMKKVESLQNEKLLLTSALENKRRQFDKQPQVMDTIPSQDREDLKEVVDIFNDILAENHRKLMVAKAINHTILRAVTDVTKRNAKSKVYNIKGNTAIAPYETLSVTLNKMI